LRGGLVLNAFAKGHNGKKIEIENWLCEVIDWKQ